MPIPASDTIYCTPPPRFASVAREPGAQGTLYCLWHPERPTAWLGQSVPPLLRALNEKGVYYKLHVSSIYRMLRGQHQSQQHHGWRVLRCGLDDLQPLNELLSTKLDLVVVCRCPDSWVFE